MKKDLIKTLLAFSLFTATASYSIQAAPGDLYDGGLNDQKVYKFDTAGNRTVFVSGSATFQPDWLAFDSKGNLFASNPAHSAISKIPPDGSTITDFATGINPGNLAFDAAGNLFAFDATTNSIFKYTPSGARSGFAGPGLPSGALNDVVGLAFARNGDLFATRRGSGAIGTGSIVKFTPDGTMTTFYAAQPGGLFLPMGLAFDSSGNLYEADSGSGSIFKFAPNGMKTTFKTGLNAPRSLAFDDNGILFVGEFGANDIVKITPAGSLIPFASATAVGGLAFERPTDQLLNISTRASVQTGAGVTIVGFIITGTDPKQVVVRGLGPELMQSGINNFLADPTLDLRDSNQAQIGFNNNWKDNSSQVQMQLQALGLAPNFDSESAILITLPPGSYTAILSGNGNNPTGIGRGELYDVTSSAFSELANISTRGFVGTNNAVMIGGTITGRGNGFTQIVVRGRGPSLPSSVPGRLNNPFVGLYNSQGTAVRTNDNWKTDQQAEIQATGLAPTDDLEAALITTIGSGAYTAILQGVGGTGIGIVEIYKIR